MTLDELRGHVRQADTIAFLDAWLTWRGPRLLPRRSDVQLRDITRFIDRVILFEIVGPEEVFVRVAGSTMRDLIGAEMTGKNFRQFSSASDWVTRSHRFMTMASIPCGSCMVLRDLLPSGRTVVYEIVQLPIDPDEPGKPRQLIASNVTVDRYFADPKPQEGRVVPIPGDYYFIDIGGGAPDKAVSNEAQ
jgi:hypothetical protein